MRRLVGTTIIAALPATMALALIAWLFDSSFGHATPYISDEIAYWREIAAFRVAGFRGGYHTLNEQVSRVASSPFGPHGPGSAMVFGLLSWPVQWGYASGPIYGALIVTLSVGLWLWMSRPPAILAAALLATAWPIVIALPNTLPESLHFAFAFLFAALIPRAITTPSRGWWLLTAALLVVAGMVRPFWALLAVPLGAVAWGRRGLVAGIALVGVLFLTYSVLASPYPIANHTLGLDLVRDPIATMRRVVEQAVVEHLPAWLWSRGNPLELLYRYEMVAVVLLAAVLARRTPDNTERNVLMIVAGSGALLVAAVLAMGYIGDWHDYRYITPVLFALLAMLAPSRPRWILVAVVVHVVAAPVAITMFHRIHEPRFTQDRLPAIRALAEQVEPHITFDPNASAWENTVLVSAESYRAPLLGLPPGIGTSILFDWKAVRFPVRSRYLLLTDGDAAAALNRLTVRKVADTKLGTLYEQIRDPRR